ncbi:hypothetical protein C8P69_12223, partial [Phreatobacter oligotrophus]
DDADVRQLVATGLPAIRVEFTDGGMHGSFRDILQRDGVERLRAMTSARVEVSRPQAVLAPPREVMLEQAAASGGQTSPSPTRVASQP